MGFLSSIFRRKEIAEPFYRRTEYSFDGKRLIANDPKEERIEIALEEVEEIGVQTTSTGPFAEDVFWLINREKEKLLIPQESLVFSELVEVFQKFEGFSNESFGLSMTCTDDQYFECWKKGPANKSVVTTPEAAPPTS